MFLIKAKVGVQTSSITNLTAVGMILTGRRKDCSRRSGKLGVSESVEDIVTVEMFC